jgi:4-methyl-5(b-hydroxyethyl)-thiazole monophosphate biosynthesis
MPKVLILLAPGCEEIEAVTVIDILRRASIDVVSAGLEVICGPVTCSRGVVLVPDATLDDVIDDHFDMVVLPGGQPGTDNLRKDKRVRSLLQKTYANNKYVAAICAAPMVLAEAGLLHDKTATSYPGCLDESIAPQTIVKQDMVVKDGKIVTSRGPGTAIDFALVLVESLTDKTTRDRVEAGLQRPH